MHLKQIVIITAGTIFVLLVSWLISLKYRNYHGIARFFIFESIFLLIYFDLPYWFRRFHSLHQILSSIIMTFALVLAVVTIYQFLKRGKPKGNFENTTILIQQGLYKWIRHPMYGSLLLFAFGLYLKRPFNTINIILIVISLLAGIITAMLEEKEMINKFGDEYREYMKKTKRFIPFLV